jgi:hypothetical protein
MRWGSVDIPKAGSRYKGAKTYAKWLRSVWPVCRLDSNAGRFA